MRKKGYSVKKNIENLREQSVNTQVAHLHEYVKSIPQELKPLALRLVNEN